MISVSLIRVRESASSFWRTLTDVFGVGVVVAESATKGRLPVPLIISAMNRAEVGGRQISRIENSMDNGMCRV